MSLIMSTNLNNRCYIAPRRKHCLQKEGGIEVGSNQEVRGQISGTLGVERRCHWDSPARNLSKDLKECISAGLCYRLRTKVVDGGFGRASTLTYRLVNIVHPCKARLLMPRRYLAGWDEVRFDAGIKLGLAPHRDEAFCRASLRSANCMQPLF